MNKKFFVSLAITIFSIFSFTLCFAADNGNGLGTAANNVRNFVGGVENTVENAALDVSNTSKNITSGVENGGKYSTTRTSTNDGTMGMSSNTWTWLILGIAAIAIIAVVWYYSMQFTNGNKHNNNDDE